MDKLNALDSFAALGQDTRLEAFRLLVRSGDAGMAAGEIAEKLGVRQNTMSANLSVLHQAGLVRNRREGRSIRYYADFDGLRGLLEYLMEDCCGGKPDICRPVLDAITCKC
ncbi:metalloregulator ArsR/SmtB family transcription factor [Thalassovita sp.]|jgi:DNA-binding transcriptional ArsR family regulator|uniref:ArsR/SmtB family transcription factor n=1 Tax=Thalassovita sp. TaxID=1979401 RepID=UPI0029DE8611|nr:metalloregulator ArsR/SmtB family transcription factor [Thalassovita sp.]